MANVGTLVGQITMTYSEKVWFHPPARIYDSSCLFLQYVGFWLAYTLPTVVFLMCPIVLFAARKRYIRYPPTGSVLVIFFRLIRFASHGRWSLNPFRTWRNLTANDFWDSAKPSHIEPEERPRWMRFDDQWVDEVRRGLKACAVFCWYPLYCAFFFACIVCRL
jgi:POT family proton-dependent oligopeptide transporter